MSQAFDVVVIGGGMTAVDAAVQSKLLGAENVTIVYRRGPEHMGASVYEQEIAQTDGVLLRHWLRPRRLLAEGGRLSGVISCSSAFRSRPCQRSAGKPLASAATMGARSARSIA